MKLASPIGLDQATVLLFEDYKTDGPMWVGEGSRELRRAICFSQHFVAPPAVIVGLSLWDYDHKSNLRGELLAENITAKGFDLVFRTWGDSRIARLGARWTALGPLVDEDQWALD